MFNNAFLLDPAYFTLTNRSRVVFITTNGQEVAYTQTGDAITPPILSMTNSSWLNLRIARGSDTYTEVTTNFINWQMVDYLPWSANTNATSFSVTPTNQIGIYRAYSE